MLKLSRAEIEDALEEYRQGRTIYEGQARELQDWVRQREGKIVHLDTQNQEVQRIETLEKWMDWIGCTATILAVLAMVALVIVQLAIRFNF